MRSRWLRSHDGPSYPVSSGTASVRSGLGGGERVALAKEAAIEPSSSTTLTPR
jgi:hypothetical protein